MEFDDQLLSLDLLNFLVALCQKGTNILLNAVFHLMLRVVDA